ncbi:MAG: ArsR family transcriptional regulator, lead/cadmium/zinc/bismuth-responsive transcriptional [Methanolobus sp.]|jgi:ArsR family transcriptional regulator|uniref:Putative transcriptional regulator n=2 Tax=Methanosarcinaceae TaxID=2206 RepID=W9DQX0_METTI|nr:putative transcriptional regulator [Methanolobus tindarius DSM 2278]MDI3484864.1 ArsR family transcriptional regulator, lead/cadmium/zinc/bismuth-responsive transcriptional [Methanolobus sp.]MDK2939221.1 ArsR family transcriptional regulator, lead/cadmium/zinc/bismuth-responsive transcriptional [Methanolobus sp.]
MFMDNSEHVCADSTCLDDRVRHLPSEDSIYSMCKIFNALQCTTRLKILFLLLQGDLCVKAIEDSLGLTQSAISHSLKNLRQLDLVRVRKEGRFAVYYLADQHVELLVSMCREHVEEVKK